MELTARLGAGDERNVVPVVPHLVQRNTGKIAPKDVAADWATKRLPAQYQPVLQKLNKLIWDKKKILASRADRRKKFIRFVKARSSSQLVNDVDQQFVQADRATRGGLTPALGAQ